MICVASILVCVLTLNKKFTLLLKYRSYESLGTQGIREELKEERVT